MSGFSNSVVGGIGNLIRDWIQSVPFVSGSQGWRISRNGDAEFNNATFRGSIIITGSHDILVYSTPSPTVNKLIIALAGSAGNDGLGNSWGQGINLYDNNGHQIGTWSPTEFNLTGTVINPGNINVNTLASSGLSPIMTFQSGSGLQDATNVFNLASLFVITGGGGTQDAFRRQGPTNQADTSQSSIFIDLVGANGSNIDTAYSTIHYNSTTTGLAKDLARFDSNGGHLYGTVDALDPNFGFGALESWHIPTLQAGWGAGSNSGGIQQLRYRLLPTNEVELQGVIHSTSATPASVMFILPAGYTPPSTVQRMGIIINKGGGVIAADIVDFHPGGNVQLGINAAAIGNDVHFDHTFSLAP